MTYKEQHIEKQKKNICIVGHLYIQCDTLVFDDGTVS